MNRMDSFKTAKSQQEASFERQSNPGGVSYEEAEIEDIKFWHERPFYILIVLAYLVFVSIIASIIQFIYSFDRGFDLLFYGFVIITTFLLIKYLYWRNQHERP
jgi:hypothetical protein